MRPETMNTPCLQFHGESFSDLYTQLQVQYYNQLQVQYYNQLQVQYYNLHNTHVIFYYIKSYLLWKLFDVKINLSFSQFNFDFFIKLQIQSKLPDLLQQVTQSYTRYPQSCTRYPQSYTRYPQSCTRYPQSCTRYPQSCTRYPQSYTRYPQSCTRYPQLMNHEARRMLFVP